MPYPNLELQLFPAIFAGVGRNSMNATTTDFSIYLYIYIYHTNWSYAIYMDLKFQLISDSAFLPVFGNHSVYATTTDSVYILLPIFNDAAGILGNCEHRMFILCNWYTSLILLYADSDPSRSEVH